MINLSMIGPIPIEQGGVSSGGVAVYLYGLTNELSQLGLAIDLLADNTDISNIPAASGFYPGVKVHYFIRDFLSLFRIGWKDLFPFVSRIRKDGGLNLIIDWQKTLLLTGQAINFLDYFSKTNCQLVHVMHAEYRQFLFQQLIRDSKPVIATVHSISIFLRENPVWLRTMTRNNYRNADWLIPVSNALKQNLIDLGTNPDRMTVIPPGLDVNQFIPAPISAARRQLNLSEDDFILLFVGNLKIEKGIDVLLKVVQRLKDKFIKLKLLVIGSGEEKDTLIKKCVNLNLYNKVVFTDFVHHDQLPTWYQAADLFILPSKSEGFGISILEAMATAKPVIATIPHNGFHDAVSHGETGFMTRYGDVDELCRLIAYFYDHPTVGESFGEAGRRLVEKEFTWQIVGKKTIEVYKQVLERKSYSEKK